MFDFIRKPQLWNAWDTKLDKKFPQTSTFHLKTLQDFAVYDLIKDMRGANIAEVGGGASRLLQSLSKGNNCANIEKFEGADGGPSAVIEVPSVKNYLTFLGEFNAEVPSNYFDVVFSVSVVEHVPTENLQDFFKDGLRILKPGGVFIHAIDLYLSDDPSKYWILRYENYRNWLALGSGLEPTGKVFRGPLAFTCDMATNPDNTMYNWGSSSPDHIELRKQSQSVSLIVCGRKQ